MSGPICRLCLKTEKVQNCPGKYINIHGSDNGVPIATLIKTLVPELFLGLSVNPVICPPCYDGLRDAYSFRLQCLRSEKLINIFLRETHCTTSTIALQDVVNYWLNVYKKPCRTEVARENLAEWFGVELKDDDNDSEEETYKAMEKQVVLNSMLKSNDLLGEEISMTESSDKEKVCNCQQRDDCPTSAKFKQSMNLLSPQALRKILEEHFRCVVICENRHSADCISRFLKTVKQKDNSVSAARYLMRPKTYKKKTKSNENALPENLENYFQLVPPSETVQISPEKPSENISTSESPTQKDNMQSKEATQNSTCSQTDEMRDLVKQIKLNIIETATSVDGPSESSEKPAQSEKDEESLGIITFKPDLIPSEQTGKPMPMIRVRPVSSLQKVRTLNHDLFEQSTKISQIGRDEKRHREKQPLKDDLVPPIILNSSIVSGISSPHTGSKNRNDQMKFEKIVSTKLIPVTLEHVKKMGVNPRNLPRVKVLKPLRKLFPKVSPQPAHAEPVPKVSPQPAHAEPVSVNVQSRRKEVFLGPMGIGDGAGCSQKNSGALEDEDIIDIKEEPLEYDDRDSVNELEALDQVSDEMDQWDGETTRSASETSLMERLGSENISNLLYNIPEVAEEQFDEPEYVHINNVSFADISKLMKECQKPKRTENLPGPNPVPPNLPQLSKNFIPNRIRSFSKKKSAATTRKRNTDDSGNKSVYRSRSIKRSGKRLRLVPVDVGESEIPETLGKKRSFRRTIVRPVETNIQTDQNNVCVLFTNFTSEGDYINDHDYLINPYMRNRMSLVRQNEETCICLLCDYEHPADRHIQHMKFHSTTCAICRVDFNNVFILNLHVRGHTSRCRECSVRVTYARYRHHAETHNKSLMLSNIDIPPELPRENTKKKIKLEKLVAKPPRAETDDVSKRNDESPSRGRLRRSRRLTRARNNDALEPDEEEACIYDKATKSFITPTIDKQQKLLARCSTEKNETEKNQPDKLLATNEIKKESEVGFINIANLDKPVENLIINYKEKSKGKRINIIRTNKKRRRLFTTNKKRRKALKEKHVENTVEDVMQKTVSTSCKDIKTETENAVNEPESEMREKKAASESETSISPQDNLDGTKDPPDEEIARKKSPTRRKSPKSEPRNSGSNASDAKNPIQNELSNNPLATKVKLPKSKKVVSNKMKFAKKKSLPQNRKSFKAGKVKLSTKGHKAMMRRIKPIRKAPLGGDLKIKIKGIKLNPFVTLSGSNGGNRTGQDSVAAEAPPRLSRIRKRKRKNSGGDLKPPVLETQGKPDHNETNPVETDAIEQPELVNPVLKKDDGRIRCKKKVEKNVVLNPLSTGSRSSRSKGSLHLVEGLKIDGPSRPKKSRKPLPSTIPSSTAEHNVTSSEACTPDSTQVCPTKDKSIEGAVECEEKKIVDIKGNTNVANSDPGLSKLECTKTCPIKENPVQIHMDLDEEVKKETEEIAAKLEPERLTEEKSADIPMEVDEEDASDFNLANLFKEKNAEIHMEVDEENVTDDKQP